MPFKRVQHGLSELTFGVTRTQIALNNVVKLPVISTGRPFSYYRNVFFGGRSEDTVLAELKGKAIVDVGCGLTPYVSDSMFQACRRAGIEFYGIDPKIGKEFLFGTFDHLKVWATGGGRLDRNAPGTERAKAAFANQLPFENGKADLILTSFLLTVWINDEQLLAGILREFFRVLKPGGQAKIYPHPKLEIAKIKTTELAEAYRLFDTEQQFLFGLKLVNYPPAYVTTLTKPEK